VLRSLGTVDGSETWYALGQRDPKKTERITGEISLSFRFLGASVLEKKRGGVGLFSAVKGVVNSAEDVAKFGINSSVGASKFVGGGVAKGVKMTVSTAGAGIAGVGGIAAAGVGTVAGGIGDIAGGIGGGVRTLTSSSSKKKISRVPIKTKQPKRVVAKRANAVYQAGPAPADIQAIKNFMLTLRPHEKYVAL
jgi:hypothetical protein